MICTPLMPRLRTLILSIVLAVLFCLNGTLPANAAASTAASGKSLDFASDASGNKDFSGRDLRTEEFPGADLDKANFSNSNLEGAVFSTSTLRETNFQGANLNQVMMDQVRLLNVNLSDAVLTDAMLLRTEFRDANVTGADFSGAILSALQVKELCKSASGTNSKTGVDTRESLGCR
ncbi:pentapeptide repeat-containing protein [Phormidesmis sp. 146-12]